MPSRSMRPMAMCRKASAGTLSTGRVNSSPTGRASAIAPSRASAVITSRSVMMPAGRPMASTATSAPMRCDLISSAAACSEASAATVTTGLVIASPTRRR
jgi:hypothetical protein